MNIINNTDEELLDELLGQSNHSSYTINLIDRLQVTVNSSNSTQNLTLNGTLFMGTSFNTHSKDKIGRTIKPWNMDRAVKQSLILRNHNLTNTVQLFYIIKVDLLSEQELIIKGKTISKQICRENNSWKYFDTSTHTFFLIPLISKKKKVIYF